MKFPWDGDEEDENAPDQPEWDQLRVAHSRAGDQSPEAFTGLSDPTRWGAEGSVVLTTTGRIIPMHQLLRVQVEDPYPRNWQIIGTMTADDSMWDVLDNFDWAVVLELLMGQGQATVRHWVNVGALIRLCVPTVTVPESGPYYSPITEGGQTTYPWVLPGGVVGRAISARLLFAVNSEEAITLPQTVNATMQISPYAAGHNL